MTELVFAFVLALALTPLLRRLAFHFRFLDQPNHRKIHHVAVPLLGGLAIYLGSLAGVVAGSTGGLSSDGLPLWTGGLVLMLVGTMDDRGFLHSQFKLVVAIPIAAGILMLGGFRATLLSELLPGKAGVVGDAILTLLWIVAITSAFSILDHMDGLCAGVAAIAATFFLVVGSLIGDPFIVAFAAAILGGSAGFLYWNTHPARIFMGDGGAMFLGLAFAALALRVKSALGPAAGHWAIPLLILGVPIFDTTLVTFSRLRRGLNPSTSPGRDHAAHRLVSLGRTQRQAVFRLYSGGALAGMAAVGALLTGKTVPVVVVGTAAIVGVVLIHRLELAPYERQEYHGAPAPKAVLTGTPNLVDNKRAW